MNAKITTLIALTIPIFKTALKKGFDTAKEVMDPEEAMLMLQDIESIDPAPLFETMYQDLTDAETDFLIQCYSSPVYTSATEKVSMASMQAAKFLTQQIIKKSNDRYAMSTALLRQTPTEFPN